LQFVDQFDRPLVVGAIPEAPASASLLAKEVLWNSVMEDGLGGDVYNMFVGLEHMLRS
jgi:hypothetical protein